MRMTLPTTRIDTLSSPGLRGESLRNNQNNPQDILLVDFVPNTTTMIHSSSNQQQQHHHPLHHPSTGVMVMPPPVPQSQSQLLLNRYPIPVPTGNNGYPVHIQQQLPPPPQSHLSLPMVSNQNHVNHNNNDLSNFTLVNLSNQPEPGEEDDENLDVQLDEEQIAVNYVNMKSHIPLRRSSIPGAPMSTPLPLSMFAANDKAGNKVSSSLSTSTASSDDSDTGFLVPLNNGSVKGRFGGKDGNTRPYHHNRVQSNSVQSTSYPGSPGFNSGNHQQTHRKRLRRRRSSGRRKPNSQPEHNEPNDLMSMCCCFGDDDNHHHPNNHNRGQNSNPSLTTRYLRFSCFIVLIIAIATFASIMVSLQRKVDSLSWEVKKVSTAGSQSGSSTSPPGANSDGKSSGQDNRNPSPSEIQDLIAKQEQLNSSYSSLKATLDELSQRIGNLEKQPSVEEVRQDLARLGSDLEGSIKELQQDVGNLKNSNNVKKSRDDVSSGKGIINPSPDAASTAASSSGLVGVP